MFLSIASFAQSDNSERDYGKNILTFKPFMGYATPQLSDVGIGITYEHFLNDYVSGKLPFNIGLTKSLYQGGIGLKFYPAGHERPVKYAVGPTILFSRAESEEFISLVDTNGIYTTTPIHNPLTQVGFMLTNSLNLTIQKNIYLGVEMGLGLNYINHYQNKIVAPNTTYYDEDPNVLFQFNIEMGYRF